MPKTVKEVPTAASGLFYLLAVMKWELKKWEELNANDLYHAYKLRIDVFVVEQGCAYPEVDEHDPYCEHLFGWEDDKLAVYSRICPPATVYPYPSLGRIVVTENYRGKRLARQVIDRGLALLEERFPGQPIKIQAQQYLEKFYQSFGFKTITESYPDAGVMHVDMVKDYN